MKENRKMQQISEIIIGRIFDSGWSETLYLLIDAFSMVLAIVISVILGRRLKVKAYKTIIAVVLDIGAVYLEMAILQTLVRRIVPETIPVMNTYMNNVGRTFVLVPITALIVSMLLNVEFNKICCFYTISQTIIWGIASTACIFTGCCSGYACEWGIYNAYRQEYVFPTQLINATLLLLIAVFSYWRIKKNQYQPDGKEYPIALCLIGLTRFSTEFLMENDKIVWGLSSLSFDAMGMCLVGIIWLLLLCVAGQKNAKRKMD